MSLDVQNTALNQNLKITDVPSAKVQADDEAEEKNLELVENNTEDVNELITVNKEIEDIGITDAAAINYFDADGDGKVSLSEFIGGILTMFGITGEENTEDPSGVDDPNTDESTDAEGAEGAGGAEDPAVDEDKTAEIDTNGDGKITQEEIDAYNYKTQDRTADLDLNGDGIITQEEIDAYNTRHADEAPADAEPAAISADPADASGVDAEPADGSSVGTEPADGSSVDSEPADGSSDADPASEAPADGESDISVLDYDGDHVVTQEEMQRYIDENGVAAFYDAFGELLGDNSIEY